MKSFDVVVVGSGPNGLSAAITLAKEGLSVVVLEAASTLGGGARTEEATEPGFLHDVCSAVHPLGAASPFFQSLNLQRYGLQWVHSPAELAHPLADGEAILLKRSVEETAQNLGADGERYFRFMQPLAIAWRKLIPEILQPVLHWPRHPLILARFGLNALLPTDVFARRVFHTPEGQALFAGIAAHANAPLEDFGTTSIGLMLMLAAHAEGWPVAKGGSQKIADALMEHFFSLGGEIRKEFPVRSRQDLPTSRFVVFDLTPKQIFEILKESNHNLDSLRNFRYGNGVFKMDWALSDPIPWQASSCRQAATVHLGGTLEEIMSSERAPQKGMLPHHPYVLLSQPSLFDPTRTPAGCHTAWAYCHVPFGSKETMVDAIENQIERFAPGFRSRILSRRAYSPSDLEMKNPNLVGGDISGGAVHLRQLLFRPRPGLHPYRLEGGFYICSASTPPGPGVHGMCGYYAAQSLLKEIGLRSSSDLTDLSKN